MKEDWDKRGDVTVLPPRLLLRGRGIPLGLDDIATDASTPDCVSVLFISAESAVFSLTFEQAVPGTRRDFPLSSTRGALEITRCGLRKAALRGAIVEASSPRVVLSMLALRTRTPPPSSGALLPHRHAGPPARSMELGPRPRLGPLPERLAAKVRERQARRPADLGDTELVADEMGHVRQDLDLEAGCHTLDLLDASPEAGRSDLDARLVDAFGERWALDASVAPEASLLVCLGEPRVLTLDVRGAAPTASLALLRSAWPLPDGLPVEWGARVRGRLAEVLRELPLAAQLDPPIASSLGVQGTTRMSVSVEPGLCYVAAVAALDREPERLGIAARAGGVTSLSPSRADRSSALVISCADGPELAVTVDSLGRGASYLLGVWELPSRGEP